MYFVHFKVGDCYVGEKHAELFIKECSDKTYLFEYILHVSDDKGVYRPCSIWGTPGFWNDGFGNEWPDDKWGSEEVINVFNEAAKEHLFEADASEFIANGPNRYPAYQSVAIFFSRQPSQETLDFLCERAHKFEPIDKWYKVNFNITGFRLLKEEIVHTELWKKV